MNQLNLPLSSLMGRRTVLRAGGITATALVLAACGGSEVGPVGRVGEGQPTPELEPEVIDDSVLLRTMAGVETSIVEAYAHILESGALAGSSSAFPDLGDQTELVTLLQEHHSAAATTFNELAVAAGAEAWECGNTRLDSAFIGMFVERVENGAPATDAALAIEPSDDPTRDMINLVYVLESLSAASCQAMVHAVTDVSLRGALMAVGVRSARQSSLVALTINPGGYLSAATAPVAAEEPAAAVTTTSLPEAPAEGADAPPPTEIPLPVAIPAQFGLLSPVVLIGGRGDENGVRMKLNFETPSLNSLAYPFETCEA